MSTHIQWTHVTWYSKFLAAVFFIFIFPALAFYVGKEYGYTERALVEYTTTVNSVEQDSLASLPTGNMGMTEESTFSSSGIVGNALYLDGTPYTGSLSVLDHLNTVVTETLVREDGRFLLLLDPGEYTILTQDPAINPILVLVEKGQIARVNLSE